MMPFMITWSADRPTHRMVGDKCTAHSHSARYVFECADIDPDSRDARRFEDSLYVPHGHVADRSNGYQQNRIDRIGSEHRSPCGGDPVTKSELRRGTDEGVRLLSHLTDDSGRG